jgi:hypothetical protein
MAPLPAVDVVARTSRQPSRLELRAFAGLAMASAAISIDLILPAFSRIRSDLGLASNSAATAGLVTGSEDRVRALAAALNLPVSGGAR